MRAEAKLADGREITLEDGLLAQYRDRIESAKPVRTGFAAAHLVLHAEHDGELADVIDWDATMAQRRRLDGFGFGIAEAMDTAQRFEVGWPVAERLIEECGRLGLEHGFIAGASYDHVEKIGSTDELVEAVVYQCHAIEAAGGIPILLPMEWLVANHVDADGYVDVYTRIAFSVRGPVFVHWLGEVFHPGLHGYFPEDSFSRVMESLPERIVGAKLSLLDAALEHRIRQELAPRQQIVLTGDDYHFARLIFGGEPSDGGLDAPEVAGTRDVGGLEFPLGDFSHALLGVLDAVAEPAGIAFSLLARGETRAYFELMQPCERLGQWIFQDPTPDYKAGLVCLAWLNGWQEQFRLPNRLETKRDLDHYVRLAELASEARALVDASLATKRLEQLAANS